MKKIVERKKEKNRKNKNLWIKKKCYSQKEEREERMIDEEKKNNKIIQEKRKELSTICTQNVDILCKIGVSKRKMKRTSEKLWITYIRQG